MSYKHDLSNKLIDLLPADYQLTLDQALSQWWVSKHNSRGYRLTEKGCDIFVNVLDLEYYQFSINSFSITPKLLLALSSKINCPYYLEKSKNKWENIWLFGSKDAMMITLWGDLERFLTTSG